jgi:hypothetical protein
MNKKQEYSNNQELFRKSLDERVKKVKQAHSGLGDNNLFSLVLIVNQWSLDSYFAILEMILKDTDSDVLQAWYANFTKVLIFSGNPSSSYIDKHLSFISDDFNIGAVLIQDDGRQPKFLRLLKTLRTRGEFELPYFQNKTFSSKSNLDEYVIEIGEKKLLLERFIVHCTHIFCEFFIEKKAELPVSLKVKVVEPSAVLQLTDYDIARVVPNKTQTEFLFVGGIYKV